MVVAWVIVLVVAPVVTGTIKPPESTIMTGESGQVMPSGVEGEIPPGLGDPFAAAPDGSFIEVTPDMNMGEMTAEPEIISGEAEVAVTVEPQQPTSDIAAPTALPVKKP